MRALILKQVSLRPSPAHPTAVVQIIQFPANGEHEAQYHLMSFNRGGHELADTRHASLEEAAEHAEGLFAIAPDAWSDISEPPVRRVEFEKVLM